MEISRNEAKIEEYRAKAKELVSKMTLEEKVSQTIHHAVAIDRLDTVAEKIKIRLIDNLGLEDATKYGNKNAKQQDNSYSTVMKYEIADCVDDLLDDLEEMKAEVQKWERE